MFTVERDVVINRPIEQVFTFVENFENEPLFHLLLPILVEKVVSNIKKVLEAQPLMG